MTSRLSEIGFNIYRAIYNFWPFSKIPGKTWMILTIFHVYFIEVNKTLSLFTSTDLNEPINKVRHP